MPQSILFITHVIPFPPAAGNEIRILKMTQYLKQAGFNVIFLFNVNNITSDLRRKLEEIIGSVHTIGDDYGNELEHAKPRQGYMKFLADKLTHILIKVALYGLFFGKEKQKKTRSDSVKNGLAPERLIRITELLCDKYKPCAVVAEYIFTAPCLDAVPEGTLKIIDTHDMFSRKQEQVIAYGIDDPLLCSPQEERSYLLKSNLIIAIQGHEARLFGELTPEREVITVGVDCDIVGEVDDNEVVPGSILIVGSDNPLNIHGLKEFYANAWPTIRAADPTACLRIIGKIGAHLPTDDKRVKIAGWVENLDEEYKRAAVVVNPTVAGTGLKIKSVEAICHAKALVGTRNSMEGIEFAGEPPFIACEDWHELAKSVIDLIRSGEKLRKLQDLALFYATNNYTGDKVYAPLIQKLRYFCESNHHEHGMERI